MVAALVVFARKVAQVARAGLDRDPFRVRHADPPRNPDRAVGIAIWLAALHQAVGTLLLAATVWGAHELEQRSGTVGPGADRAERGRIADDVIRSTRFSPTPTRPSASAAPYSRSASPPASTSFRPFARSIAGKARSRRADEIAASSRPPRARRRPDRPDRRAAQLRRSLRRRLADRQDFEAYADWVEDSTG